MTGAIRPSLQRATTTFEKQPEPCRSVAVVPVRHARMAPAGFAVNMCRMTNGRRSLGLAIAVGLTLAVAPNETPAQPAPATELSAADTAKLIEFFDKLVAAMVANKDNCAKVAT